MVFVRIASENFLERFSKHHQHPNVCERLLPLHAKLVASSSTSPFAPRPPRGNSWLVIPFHPALARPVFCQPLKVCGWTMLIAVSGSCNHVFRGNASSRIYVRQLRLILADLPSQLVEQQRAGGRGRCCRLFNMSNFYAGSIIMQTL